MNKTNKKIKQGLWTSLLVLTLTLPVSAYAGWGDVVDVLTEILGINKEQLGQLKDINQLGQKSLDEFKRDLSGNFGYGSLLNTPDDLKKRLWSNDRWMDVLKNVSNDKTSAFSKAQEEYAKLYPVVSPDAIASTLKDGGLTRTFYTQSSQISRAALAASSFSYDQLNQHIEAIHSILTKLDSQPSTKAAIDLNTRLVAELSFIQLEMLKQQTVQTQLHATQSQNQVNGMSSESKFMQFNPS